MRSIRSMVRAGVPVLGTLIIFGAVLFLSNLVVQVAVVLVGILLLQTGMWRMAAPVALDERRHPTLRREVGYFIDVVRALHSTELNYDRQTRDRGGSQTPEPVQALRIELTATLERIFDLAGRPEEEVSPE